MAASAFFWSVLWRPLAAGVVPPQDGEPSPSLESRRHAALFVRLQAAWWLLWLNVLPLALFILAATKRLSPGDGVGIRLVTGALIGWISLAFGLQLAAKTERLVMIGIYRLVYRRAPPADW